MKKPYTQQNRLILPFTKHFTLCPRLPMLLEMLKIKNNESKEYDIPIDPYKPLGISGVLKIQRDNTTLHCEYYLSDASTLNIKSIKASYDRKALVKLLVELVVYLDKQPFITERIKIKKIPKGTLLLGTIMIDNNDTFFVLESNDTWRNLEKDNCVYTWEEMVAANKHKVELIEYEL